MIQLVPRGPDRTWFAFPAVAAWMLSVAAVLLGGSVGLLVVSVDLCQEDYSPGSDTYCSGDGGEASIAAMGLALLTALVVPSIGVLTGRKRVFWVGLAVGPALAVLDIALSLKLGRAG